jgi:uncharacterized protein (TIGR01777 family)
MKVFITGGTGLIGRLLVKRLLQRGDDVIVLSRNKDNAKKELLDKAEVIEGNAVEPGGWQDIISTVDAVINLAGEPVSSGRWNAAEKKNIYESRINSTRNIVEAIKKAGKKPEVLINASAVGYYGFQNDDREISENETYGRDFLANVCSDWEDEARKAEQSGIRVVRFRIGIVLAENGGALEKMAAPFKLYAGGPIGNGKQWMSWIHLDDVIGLLLFALDNKELNSVYNATAPNPVRGKDFSTLLGKIVHRPSWLPVPSLALKAGFGEFSGVLTSGQRAVPARVLAKGYEFEFDDLNLALKNLLE